MMNNQILLRSLMTIAMVFAKIVFLLEQAIDQLNEATHLKIEYWHKAPSDDHLYSFILTTTHEEKKNILIIQM